MDQYKQRMITELQKFLSVYNTLAQTAYILDIQQGQYDAFIRVLGNYIGTVYRVDTWLDSEIRFSDEIVIRFDVFRGTRYEDKVAHYLHTLHQAFNDSLDTEVEDYLRTTSDFNEEEKTVCREFFSKVSELHRCMKASMFVDSVSDDVTSTASIDRYKETLREYNKYMMYVASKRELNALIGRFDFQIRELAARKEQVNVLFDDS